MGERGYRATAVAYLAEALYAQGRFDEAQRLTEEAEALAAADDLDAQARWRATRAKVLARRGQFGAAARLADEAVALVPATSVDPLLGECLMAKAEVLRLAGAPGQAEASLRRALQLYEDRRMIPLAERARAVLASLAEHTPRAEAVNRGSPRPPAPGTRPERVPAARAATGTARALTCPGLLPGVQHDVPLDLGKVPLVGDPWYGSACGRCAGAGSPAVHTMCRLAWARSPCSVTPVPAGACPADTAAGCPAGVPPELLAVIPQAVSASAAAATPVTRFRRVLMTVVLCFRRPPVGRAE